MALHSYVTNQTNFTINRAYHNLDNELLRIEIVNICFLTGSVAFFGIFTNVINLVAFYQQGLNTTSNISFFALTVTDLASLICQELYVVFETPLFRETGLPVVYADIQFMMIAIPRKGLTADSCFITALITTERCLCIVFPQTVHQIITPRRITLALVCILNGNTFAGMPIYWSYSFGWIFYPTANRSLFGILDTHSSNAPAQFSAISHAFLLFSTFTCVVISTIVLVVKLKQASAWRNSANVNPKYSLSKRETTALSMVVFIACIFISCYAPSVLLCIAMFCEPEFAFKGKHGHVYSMLWSFALVFETINSSVNILIYIHMSTQYRRTIKYIFRMDIYH